MWCSSFQVFDDHMECFIVVKCTTLSFIKDASNKQFTIHPLPAVATLLALVLVLVLVASRDSFLPTESSTTSQFSLHSYLCSPRFPTSWILNNLHFLSLFNVQHTVEVFGLFLTLHSFSHVKSLHIDVILVRRKPQKL